MSTVTAGDLLPGHRFRVPGVPDEFTVRYVLGGTKYGTEYAAEVIHDDGRVYTYLARSRDDEVIIVTPSPLVIRV